MKYEAAFDREVVEVKPDNAKRADGLEEMNIGWVIKLDCGHELWSPILPQAVYYPCAQCVTVFLEERKLHRHKPGGEQ
jgi:hypothetical protein